ncbi:MAG: hypothetical protein FWD06_04660 [Oscillospiraceae bacterium]|nr:hypothetical protein [Oscillospiraceae bacterium]
MKNKSNSYYVTAVLIFIFGVVVTPITSALFASFIGATFSIPAVVTGFIHLVIIISMLLCLAVAGALFYLGYRKTHNKKEITL